jgi:hypothetical protein
LPPAEHLVYAGEDAEGRPLYSRLDPDEWTEVEAPIATSDILSELDGVDAGGGGAAGARAVDGNVEVPALRVVDDPRELELIGDGLPIVHGVR